MGKSTRLLLIVPLCFTALVVWFAWTAFHTAPQLAFENLRGAGLSISAAIEQLAVIDVPAFRSLARYTTPDIAYYALIDRQGIVRFHTNTNLIGHPYSTPEHSSLPNGISEQREFLGTGEEVYLIRTKVHTDRAEYLLVLALHTYRSDQVIRRAETGVTVVAALTIALWALTLLVLFMFRREERHRREMSRREELARLGEMGAILAHEIRNPLAGIKGFAQLIETSSNLDQSKLHAAKIVSQSLRMEALVNDLLAYAREDRDERKATDLSELVRDSVSMIRMDVDSDSVRVIHDPQKPLKAMIAADRIVQMLLNMMKNGIQAMPDGGDLHVELETVRSRALIKITDSGIGIPPENLPHIFEPFWTSKARGTGLGLALCRKIAQEHGGSMTVESVVGAGTTFTVTLPLEV
jgi:two-component system sensor histidine kinase HydH